MEMKMEELFGFISSVLVASIPIICLIVVILEKLGIIDKTDSGSEYKSDSWPDSCFADGCF